MNAKFKGNEAKKLFYRLLIWAKAQPLPEKQFRSFLVAETRKLRITKGRDTGTYRTQWRRQKHASESVVRNCSTIGREVTYSGRILSILDIGTGFHPDLSGYENIFLNASLLGMKNRNSTKTNEIISFSGIGEFIHEPVKNYSSGMYVRLALSIALFINAEIVLLDEIVSAGDAEFRLKAAQEIRAGQYRAFVCDHFTILIYCVIFDNCLLLEKGEIAAYGKAGHYRGLSRQNKPIGQSG